MSSSSATNADIGRENPSLSSATNTISPELQSYNIALKILVSNGTAGSIIGRAGSTISELQSSSGSRIKLSQAGECFPGTNERVCLVQGDVARMKAGIDLILQRFILANNDDDENDGGNEVEHEDHLIGDSQHEEGTIYQLKVLIPSSACGLLIGRSGRHIKSIATASQTKIQLGQKEEISSIATSERIFSIQGRKENILQCVDILIEVIKKEIEEVGGVEENSVWRYVNMTTGYSKAVAAAVSGSGGKNPSFGGRVIAPREKLDRNLLQQHQGSGLLNPSPTQVSGGQIANPTSQTFMMGRNNTSMLNSTSQPVSSPQRRTPQSGTVDFTSLPTSAASSASIAHAASQMQQSAPAQLFKVEETAHTPEKNSTGNPPHTVTLAIPDPLIGSIIGHNGSTLTQLQLCSQTRIQISQRGEHVPGTNHRLVRISGNTKENCDAAQFWIGQRMTMAQSNTDIGIRNHGGPRRRYQGKGNRGSRTPHDLVNHNDSNDE